MNIIVEVDEFNKSFVNRKTIEWHVNVTMSSTGLPVILYIFSILHI